MVTLDGMAQRAESGNRLVAYNCEREPIITEAKKNFYDYFISFISNIPILKDLDCVKSYFENIEIENKKTLEVFISALKNRYGDKAAMSAQELIESASSTNIDKKSIKNMTSIAEDVYGRGNAKNLSRSVVIRIWPYKSMQHVGHASVTINNSNNPNVKKQIKEHMSFVPGEDPGNKMKERYFGDRIGRFNSNYKEDKAFEISERAANRLNMGVQARDEISDKGIDNVTEETIALARFKPRALQKKNKDGDWGVSAQKVYIPTIGKCKDKVTSEKQSIMFGLCESDMLNTLKGLKEDAESGKLKYTLASTSQNCSAMAARMLVAGGSENFIKFESSLITEDPNSIHKYAKQVQDKVDELNFCRQEVNSFKYDLLKDDNLRLNWKIFNDNSLNELKKDCSRLKNDVSKDNVANRDELIDLIKKNIASQIDLISDYSNKNVGINNKEVRAILEVIRKESSFNDKKDLNGIVKSSKNIIVKLNDYLKSKNENDDTKLSLCMIVDKYEELINVLSK